MRLTKEKEYFKSPKALQIKSERGDNQRELAILEGYNSINFMAGFS